MTPEEVLAIHKQGKLDEAVDGYWKLLDEDPNNYQFLYLLSTALLQQSQAKSRPLATQLLERAVMLNPGYYEALNNLGSCHMQAQRHDKAREYWKRALRCEGRAPQEYGDIWCNLGCLHVNNGDPELGLPMLKTALKLNPASPDAHWNHALILLEIGQYGEGWDEYAWGFKNIYRQNRDYRDGLPLWDGSPDGVVITWGEQGIGDELLFSSMIPDLCAVSKKVIIDCHPRLERIFRQSFPDTVIYPTRKDKYIHWVHNHPDATHRICMGDLGKYFRRSLDDFPKDRASYLKADPERVEYYKKKLAKLGDKPKVGISWTGGYKKTGKDYRSIPLMDWKPILKECDCTWISLQYTPEAYETISQAEEELDTRIYHWPSAVQNQEYMETAALVSSLDLVITVNTAVHHLAGALGKECWTMTPKAHAWRYYSPAKDGSTIPWYPTCKQYLQKQLFDWNPILQKISRDLRARMRASEVVCAN
jgi:tetratricopeptide (TPR) repeat protein